MKRILILSLLTAAALIQAACCNHCLGTGNIQTSYGKAPCPYCGGDGGWDIIPGSEKNTPML